MDEELVVLKNRALISDVEDKRFHAPKNPQKPILITFDGSRGSGKTVQTYLLSEKIKDLGLAFYITDKNPTILAASALLHQANRQISIGYKNRMSNLIYQLYTIKMCQRDPALWQRDGVVLENWFWHSMIGFDMDSSVLSAFRAFLIAYDGYEPAASFYLQTTSPERDKRLYIRNQGLQGAMIDKAIVDRDWPQSKEAKEEDDRFKQTAEWLASELPYFHVIDGVKPEETVAQNVSEILKTEGIL